MSSTDPTITNIASTLAKVSSFIPKQDAINSDIEQRFATLETSLTKVEAALAKMVNVIHCLMDANAPENHSKLPAQGTSLASSSASPASNDTTAKSTVTPSWADIARRPAPPLTDRRRQALHRFFNPNDTYPSDAKSYTFVYLPLSRRLTRTQIRSKFRALSIDNLRVLDIIFPARHTIGILLHEAYLPKFRSKLLEIDISPISYFNPIDPNHIADPKYQNLSQEDRTRLALIIHQDRCLRTLSFIRPNLLPGIAKYFIRQGWIPSNLAQDILNKRIPHPVKRHPLPHSSITNALQQLSQSSDTIPVPPSTDLPEASAPQEPLQTQAMDTTPDPVSNERRSPSPDPSPRKLRKSSKLRRSKS